MNEIVFGQTICKFKILENLRINNKIIIKTNLFPLIFLILHPLHDIKEDRSFGLSYPINFKYI